MFDADVNAQLQLAETARGVEVRAFVAADEPRPLRWKLVVESRSAGGTSNVSQGGSTDGERTDAVGAVTVTAGSQGTVTLVVYDGEQEVARDTASLEAFGDAR